MEGKLLKAKKDDLNQEINSEINYYEKLIEELREIQGKVESIEDKYDLEQQSDRLKEFQNLHKEEKDY